MNSRNGKRFIRVLENSGLCPEQYRRQIVPSLRYPVPLTCRASTVGPESCLDYVTVYTTQFDSKRQHHIARDPARSAATFYFYDARRQASNASQLERDEHDKEVRRPFYFSPLSSSDDGIMSFGTLAFTRSVNHSGRSSFHISQFSLTHFPISPRMLS